MRLQDVASACQAKTGRKRRSRAKRFDSMARWLLILHVWYALMDE